MDTLPKNFISPNARRLLYILMSSIRYEREGLSPQQFRRALAMLVYKAAKEEYMGFQIGFEDVEDVGSHKENIANFIDEIFEISRTILDKSRVVKTITIIEDKN